MPGTTDICRTPERTTATGQGWQLARTARGAAERPLSEYGSTTHRGPQDTYVLQPASHAPSSEGKGREKVNRIEEQKRRCCRWIQGRQCDGFRLKRSKFCAMHSKPKAER